MTVFRSTSQALHVAWTMEVLPASTKSSMESIYRLREECGFVARPESLNAMEFRGQCAMIRAACANTLTRAEYAAIRARYGANEGGSEGSKMQGVLVLANMLHPALTLKAELTTAAVAWSVYHAGSQRAKDRFSAAKIAEESGESVHVVRKNYAKLRDMGAALEARALDKLGERFVRDGLVPAPEYA